MVQLFDMLNKPILLGDTAAFTHGYTSKVKVGKVTKTTDKMVYIHTGLTEWRKHPDLIVIVKN